MKSSVTFETNDSIIHHIYDIHPSNQFQVDVSPAEPLSSNNGGLSANFTPCTCKTELLTITNAWFFLYKEPLLPGRHFGERWVWVCQHEDLGEVLAYNQRTPWLLVHEILEMPWEEMKWSVELFKLGCLEWIWMIQYLTQYLGCFFTRSTKIHFLTSLYKKSLVWSFPVLCKVSLPSWQVRVYTFWVYDKREIQSILSSWYLWMHPWTLNVHFFHKWRHDIMIHRGFWGSWPPESPHQGVKNLMLPAAPELRILRSLATVTSTVEKKQLHAAGSITNWHAWNTLSFTLVSDLNLNLRSIDLDKWIQSWGHLSLWHASSQPGEVTWTQGFEGPILLYIY